MRYILKFLRNLACLPLYWSSFIVPRDKNLWVFGAWLGHRYADNSRHLFEYVVVHHPEIRAIWLTHEKSIQGRLQESGLESYLINSPAGYWVSCRAGLVAACVGGADINRVGISRAVKVQLWHGIPLKKIMLDDVFSEFHNRSWTSRLARKIWYFLFPFADTMNQWDAIIATSPTIRKRMASAYNNRASAVQITGYPRNDILLKPDLPPNPLIEDLKTTHGFTRFVCYLPTHRSEGQSSNRALFDTFDATEMQECLQKHNAALLIKSHFYHQHEDSEGDTSPAANIFHLSGSEFQDANELLPFIDVVITDFSSVYIDYLLLNRPIVFAPFDLDDYITKERELYEPYEQATPGPKCYNWSQIVQQLELIFSGQDVFDDERKAALHRYHTYTDAKSCQRVVQLGKSLLSATNS